MSKGKPPVKLKRFERLLLANPTLSPTECADRIFDCKDRKVASVIAAQCLVKLKISYQELFDRMGITDEADNELLMQLRNGTKIVGYINQYKKNKDGKIEKMEPDESVSNEFIEVPDLYVRAKGLEITKKLKGQLGNGHNIKIKIESHQHFTNITVKDLEDKSDKDITDLILGRVNAGSVKGT